MEGKEGEEMDLHPEKEMKSRRSFLSIHAKLGHAVSCSATSVHSDLRQARFIRFSLSEVRRCERC